MNVDCLKNNKHSELWCFLSDKWIIMWEITFIYYDLKFQFDKHLEKCVIHRALLLDHVLPYDKLYLADTTYF